MSHQFFPLTRYQWKTWVSVIASMLLCALLIGLIFAPYWLLQNEYHRAQQKWRQLQPRHYQYEALWKGVLFQVEIQDGQIIRVVDLSTHKTPEPYFWSYAKEYVLVDELFQEIDILFITPEPSIDEYISMTYPEIIDLIAAHGIPIKSWVNPCVYPLPTIHYHSEWGYPEYLKFRGSPCNARLFGTPIPQEELIISNFKLLP